MGQKLAQSSNRLCNFLRAQLRARSKPLLFAERWAGLHPCLRIVRIHPVRIRSLSGTQTPNPPEGVGAEVFVMAVMRSDDIPNATQAETDLEVRSRKRQRSYPHGPSNARPVEVGEVNCR